MGTKEPTTSDTILWEEKEYEIMEAVNDYRESKGLNRLLPEDTNYREAEIRCDYCIDHGTITHDNLPETRARMYEKGFDTITENLAVMYKNIPLLIKAWKSSVGHDRNMLGNWKYTGVRHKVDLRGHNFYVQIFSR